MNGTKNIGYIRVSTLDQNTARQLEGVQLDKVFEDHASGKDTKRPQLDACLDYVREGDILHVHSIDRLARNLGDLLTTLSRLNEHGVSVTFHKEHLTFNGDDSPFQKLQLQIVGAVAEFERALIKERQREGITLAKKAGVYCGRKPCLSVEQIRQISARIATGECVSEIATEFGVSRQTIYKTIRK